VQPLSWLRVTGSKLFETSFTPNLLSSEFMFSLFQGLMAFLLIVTSCFMILLILVQRGRGGGITAHSAGAGGRSRLWLKSR
jgi:preprotein translocase subunit SecG